jgi:hypothetical protein
MPYPRVRPMTRRDLELFKTNPPVLLAGHRLVVQTFDLMTRAELWEQGPALPPGGHLVWQHHARHTQPVREDQAKMDNAGCLAATAEYLSKHGWPGVRF